MADVDEGRANAQQIMSKMFGELLPGLQAKYPGLTFQRAGRQRDFQDFQQFLIVGFALALLVMYAMIAVPLRSYLQPLLVVMAAIPFGYAGAVLGHLIMGFDLSMMSWMGIVALSGVVVNDSLVLVTRANEFRAMGHSVEQAAFLASKQRFRPILLTSVTTFGGLAPMIFETSVQARILIPMAISLGFGVMFSTLITLLLVPALFTMVEHLRANSGTVWHYLFPADRDRAGDMT
jgi:multidrug efflux pump subunit AcrB